MSKLQLLASSTHTRVAMRARLGHVFLSTLTIGCLPERMTLLCRQPVSEAHTKFLHTFDATNTGSQIAAE